MFGQTVIIQFCKKSNSWPHYLWGAISP